MNPRTFILLPLLALTLPLAACETTPAADDPPPPTPDYAELRAAYNQRADRIEQFWSRAVVEMRWVDEEGDSRFEQGDGPLIVRKPSEVALAMGKLGNTLFWLGSDEERFWLFDLASQDQPTTAFVGRHENADQLRSGDFPLPIQPDRLIDLLGITPLPPPDSRSRSGDDPVRVVSSDDGAHRYRVDLPGPSDSLRRTLLIDPRTHQPTRIIYHDAAGDPILQAALSGYETLEQTGSPPGAWPAVPTRIEVTLPDHDARLTLHLSDLTDGREGNRIRDTQFDFDRLLDLLKPDRVQPLDPAEWNAE